MEHASCVGAPGKPRAAGCATCGCATGSAAGRASYRATGRAAGGASCRATGRAAYRGVGGASVVPPGAVAGGAGGAPGAPGAPAGPMDAMAPQAPFAGAPNDASLLLQMQLADLQARLLGRGTRSGSRSGRHVSGGRARGRACSRMLSPVRRHLDYSDDSDDSYERRRGRRGRRR